MKLQDVIQIIKQRGFLFQVSIPGSPHFMHGKTTIEAALADSPSLEDYFQRIIKANNAKHVLIRLYSRNGTSFKDRGQHLIIFDQPQTVATEAKTETNVATTVSKSLQGIEQQQQHSNNHKMTDRDLIGYEVLKVRHELLSGAHDTLKKEHETLKKKVDDLHEEKLALVKENAVSKEKHEIEMERAKLESDRNEKNGLSGIIGELKEDPLLLKAVIGFLKPDHPLLTGGDEGTGAANQQAQIETKKYHEDPAIDTILRDLPNTISRLNGQQISRIYLIFLKFAEAPETIDQTITHLNIQA